MKNINDIDFEALSDEERAAVLQIMNEIADKGSSDKYTDILYQDYKEIPGCIQPREFQTVYTNAL